MSRVDPRLLVPTCQWLPYLNRCRCGWKFPGGYFQQEGVVGTKKREIEEHLGRPVNANEIIETKVSIYL